MTAHEHDLDPSEHDDKHWHPSNYSVEESPQGSMIIVRRLPEPGAGFPRAKEAAWLFASRNEADAVTQALRLWLDAHRPGSIKTNSGERP